MAIPAPDVNTDDNIAVRSVDTTCVSPRSPHAMLCVVDSSGRAQGSHTRGGAIRLDRAVILAAAQEICDRDGLSALTLRRLGNELGVDATAMYRHFRDKAELISALIDELFRLEVDEPDPQGHWRDNLRKLMLQWWQIYRRHEGLAAAMAGQPDDEPQLFHLTEWTVRELIRAGVGEDELGLYHQTIYNHTVGNGLVAALSPWLTDIELRDEQRRHYAALDPRRFPSSATAAPTIYPDTAEVFEFSVEVLLDAIEKRGQLVARQRN
ncbi:TetR/AcrR family transcriptional regulator [Mycolicibacterium frederiksbergense]|uniref:TetR/AcrR family transcriptional regulator n=1 Tax=Mycolicibacterium frederiksbergense TaxID=117567 RepID=UPI0024752A2E|nr:TetR family transcriptional regulator [Mycolicibacterium frederiksbergense]